MAWHFAFKAGQAFLLAPHEVIVVAAEPVSRIMSLVYIDYPESGKPSQVVQMIGFDR